MHGMLWAALWVLEQLGSAGLKEAGEAKVLAKGSWHVLGGSGALKDTVLVADYDGRGSCPTRRGGRVMQHASS